MRAVARRNTMRCVSRMGAEQARELPIPGRELKGIHLGDGISHAAKQAHRRTFRLATSRLRPRASGWSSSAAAIPDRIVWAPRIGRAASKCISSNCCRNRLRNAAESTPWPLWPMQLRTSHAHEEGCDRQWSVSTTTFTGHNGHVTKLHGQRVAFEGGKFIPVPNSDFEMDADLVLLAMGFTGPVKNGLLDSLGVDYDARGMSRSTTVHDQSRRRLCRRRHQTRRVADRLGHRGRPKNGRRHR